MPKQTLYAEALSPERMKELRDFRKLYNALQLVIRYGDVDNSAAERVLYIHNAYWENYHRGMMSGAEQDLPESIPPGKLRWWVLTCTYAFLSEVYGSVKLFQASIGASHRSTSTSSSRVGGF